MASKKGIDNPFGFSAKLTPEEEAKMRSTAGDVDDPFEGKKLVDLDEPEKGMKSKAAGKTRGMAKKLPISAGGIQTTPYGMTQKQLDRLTRFEREALEKAAKTWHAYYPPASTTQKVKDYVGMLKGRPGLSDAVTRVPSAAGKLVSRAAGPVGAAFAARDIYEGVTSPGFAVGMMQLLGGEEAAYNKYVEQQAEMGIEVPSYEEYVAQKAAMEAGEMPDTRDVAKRALAPRYEQEMGPEDME